LVVVLEAVLEVVVDLCLLEPFVRAAHGGPIATTTATTTSAPPSGRLEGRGQRAARVGADAVGPAVGGEAGGAPCGGGVRDVVVRRRRDLGSSPGVSCYSSSPATARRQLRALSESVGRCVFRRSATPLAEQVVAHLLAALGRQRPRLAGREHGQGRLGTIVYGAGRDLQQPAHLA
jgi:hypothetical protein